MTVSVDFGSPFKDRVSSSLELWTRNLAVNLEDIWGKSATKIADREKGKIGIALAAGPSGKKNVEQLYDRKDLVVACADHSAEMYGRRLGKFYVGTSDPTSLVAPFYERMAQPKAAVLSVFTNPKVIGVVIRRKIPRFYYVPAFKDDTDKEWKLINKIFLSMTGAPLMYGVSDAGSLALRILVGLGCSRIGLVGFDYGEEVGTPIEQWTLYPSYQQYMKDHNITDLEVMKKEIGVYEGIHSTFATKFISDRGWSYYRNRLRTLVELCGKQGISITNCTEGGSLDWDGLKCQRLKDFLDQNQATPQ